MCMKSLVQISASVLYKQGGGIPRKDDVLSYC